MTAPHLLPPLAGGETETAREPAEAEGAVAPGAVGDGGSAPGVPAPPREERSASAPGPDAASAEPSRPLKPAARAAAAPEPLRPGPSTEETQAPSTTDEPDVSPVPPALWLDVPLPRGAADPPGIDALPPVVRAAGGSVPRDQASTPDRPATEAPRFPPYLEDRLRVVETLTGELQRELEDTRRQIRPEAEAAFARLRREEATQPLY